MPRLTDSLPVGPRTLRNRLIMPPMANNKATDDGVVTPALVDHYVQRSHGPGLVIVEHAYVTPEGRVHQNQLAVSADRHVAGLAEIATAIHAGGAVAVMQITHGGARCPSAAIGRQAMAPSDIRVPGDEEDPRPMTLGEIHEIPGLFAAAAGRAAAAGFDGVEVHGAHGYLLNEFVSTYTNRRTDDYGGKLENRLLLVHETLDAVRQVLSGDALLLYRLGVADDCVGGMTPEDYSAVGPYLEHWGVHLIDCSGGLCGSRPAGRTDPGFFMAEASLVKQAVSIPVSGVGGITDPEMADRFVREGTVDAVAVGRAQLRDPEWAVRALATIGG